MKIYFNEPKDNWLSPYTIIDRAMFWRKKDDIDYDEPIVQFWNTILSPFCLILFDIRQFFNRDIRYVKIDKWDSWCMNSTLTPIILPLLIQLKENKHGAPHVDDEDVPPALRNRKTIIDGETDKHYFERWEYVMNQMIWAFDQIKDDKWEDQFWSGESDLQWSKSKNGDLQMKHGPKHTLKFNKRGHAKHYARIQNGLKLFGKYYTSLWD